VNSGKAGEVPALASVAVSVGDAEEGAIFGPTDPGELSQLVPFEMWAWTSWDMGLVFMGWQYMWKPIKEGDAPGEGHRRIELKPGCSRFLSLSSPTSPVATLHKWYYSSVATLHKRHYPPPHAPAISGSNEVLHLVSDSGDFWAARAVFVGVFPS
jgi:hypothetical protein